MQAYRLLREAEKRKPLAPSQPSAVPVQVPPLPDPMQVNSGSHGHSSAPQSAPPTAAQCAAKKPKEAWKPLDPSNVLPDPSLNKQMVEIGTIHLPIKVCHTCSYKYS